VEAVLAGLERQRDRQMAFVGAGRAEEADDGSLFDPVELGQVQDERPLGRGLGRPIEVLRFQQAVWDEAEGLRHLFARVLARV